MNRGPGERKSGRVKERERDEEGRTRERKGGIQREWRKGEENGRD